jgi:hypothetical protein
MNAKVFRQLVVAGLVLAAVLAPASVALADGPVIVSFSGTVQDEVLASCDDFDIIENSEFTIRRITWFDASGNRVRRIAQFTFHGTFTNSVTGKYVTDSPDPITDVIDYVDGTEMLHGLVFRIKLPGHGTILFDAGTIIWYPDGTVAVYGPHPLFGSLDPLCAALE